MAGEYFPWHVCFPPQTRKELELWKGSDDGSICSWVAHKELKMLLLLRNDDQKVVDKKVGLVPMQVKGSSGG